VHNKAQNVQSWFEILYFCIVLTALVPWLLTYKISKTKVYFFVLTLANCMGQCHKMFASVLWM